MKMGGIVIAFAYFHQVGPVERQLIVLNAANRHHGTTISPRIL